MVKKQLTKMQLMLFATHYKMHAKLGKTERAKALMEWKSKQLYRMAENA